MGMAIVEFGVFSWNKGHSSLNDKYTGRFVFGIYLLFVFVGVYFSPIGWQKRLVTLDMSPGELRGFLWAI